MTPSCTWLKNLNTSRSPSLMQLGLHTSTLFAWKLGGSLACSTISSIAMLNYDTHSHFETLSDHSADQLEYASSVWDPYLKKDIKGVERVQKIGTLVTTICSMSLTSPHYIASRRQQLIAKLCHSDSPTARRVSPYLSWIRSTSSATLSQIFAHTTVSKLLFPLCS